MDASATREGARHRRPYKNERAATRARCIRRNYPRRCRRYAAGLMRAKPVSASLALRRCAGLSVTITSSVGRTWAAPRCPAMALPSRVRRTIWILSAGLPCGLSAMSPSGYRYCLLGHQRHHWCGIASPPGSPLARWRRFCGVGQTPMVADRGKKKAPRIQWRGLN
jgi:hypothetical protein